jgi:transcriptional regulator with XRE-family HTH domain
VSSKPRTDEEDLRLKALGRAIRDVRKAHNVSQEALAHNAGIDRSHMGKIERGERNVTALNLLRVAKALSVQPSEIFAKAGL